MIVVTGGAGFIGSNLVHALNQSGRTDIWVVDDLREGRKFANLADAIISDYTDSERFLAWLESPAAAQAPIERVFHLGACSVTTEWDGRYMMETNHEYSKRVYEYCTGLQIPLIYASSAAVYGTGQAFTEAPANECPVNVYGWSKLVFDQYVRARVTEVRSQVVGLRYFNVYGPRERHKARMASVVWHLAGQVMSEGSLTLFAGHDGWADGEQRRDFVHVDDCNAVALWFAAHPQVSGIFNCGTGRDRSFNALARAVAQWFGGGVEIRYRDFPHELVGAYQSYTCADLDALRAAGCDVGFRGLEEGVSDYLDWLQARGEIDRGLELDAARPDAGSTP
jgi:ADP-L-glycero-D-manno-heptose 6-epimerase